MAFDGGRPDGEGQEGCGTHEDGAVNSLVDLLVSFGLYCANGIEGNIGSSHGIETKEEVEAFLPR
jgi:hypothetical protein